MLSIAWGPPRPRQPQPKKQDTPVDSSSEDEDEEEWTDSWLVTGGSDSSLRKWDVATGRVVERMGVDKVRGERTLVWTVGVLGFVLFNFHRSRGATVLTFCCRDGTIISGDSLGMVKFWDPRTCTQLYSFQAHAADVLCMVISPVCSISPLLSSAIMTAFSKEGKALYTAGVDQKTVQFSLIKISSTENGTSTTRWTQTCSRRMHSHDIRALAIWPPYTPLPSSHQHQFAIGVAPVLASGGLDMSVVLTPAALPTSTIVKVTNPLNTSTEATFEDSYHRKLAYVARDSVRVARSARLVSCAREAGLTVWKIQNKPDDPLASHLTPQEQELEPLEPEPFAGGWEKILEMSLDVHSNITAHEISDDGSWLAVSDLYESKLFSIRSDVSLPLFFFLVLRTENNNRKVEKFISNELETSRQFYKLLSQLLQLTRYQLALQPSDLHLIHQNWSYPPLCLPTSSLLTSRVTSRVCCADLTTTDCKTRSYTTE